LLKQEEGPKLDFKACISLNTDGERKELTKDIIAIANSRGGRGYIIFGVEDKTKRIIGIKPQDFKEEQIQQIIYMRCDPPIPISIDVIKYEDKEIAVMTIFKSIHKPHQLMQNGAFYVRRGSTTDVAKRSEIANLLQENGLMSYETVVLKSATMNCLDMELIKKYFSALGVVSEKPNNILLEAMGIIGKGLTGEDFHPTIGGMLLFGLNNSVYLPHSFIKVIYLDEVLCFYGNILKMLDDVSVYLEEKIIEKDYPLDAIKEAIANAMVHRDYLDMSRGITVTVTQKIIEVSNPGALIATNNIYKFMKDKNPARRNPWLYQRIMILDEKMRFLRLGGGISRITRPFAKIGEVRFLNIGDQNLFKIIFPRRKKSHYK
jgi:predicted HTH transcriptional regulator